MSLVYALSYRHLQHIHTTTFEGPVVDLWLEWKIAQTANAFAMQDRSAMHEDPNLYSRVLYRLSYIPPHL